MIIFVDVVFIQNFIINLFFLYITAQTIKLKIDLKKIIFAAFIGAVYVIILLYFKYDFLTKLPIKIAMALLMVRIAYRQKSIICNLKALFIFIFYSMVLAGACLFFQISETGGYYINKIEFKDFSNKNLFIAIMIIYIFVNRLVIYIRERRSLRSLIYKVEIVTDKYRKVVNCFLDTGNELREPITNLPVIVVEKSEFPLNIKNKDKLYIPYNAVNGENGKLEAFKPLYINIYEDKNNIQKKQVVIALCDGKLSKENDYNALLSRGIFE
ncbi:sigma-E processing peptidase SpoIIGA [Haloimpatiens sp. FM7315]|uniref:sigma-E processing peptidase SpoIIGA n=1 Tax=Haloimpatiens sp. FM7315 TaxID=3298609 RepID=UPI003709D209